MKYIIITILIIIVFLLFALSPLYGEPEKEAINQSDTITQSSSTSARLEGPATAMPQKQAATTTEKWVPPGFKGPTGAPHIQGPTSPPPNY